MGAHRWGCGLFPQKVEKAAGFGHLKLTVAAYGAWGRISGAALRILPKSVFLVSGLRSNCKTFLRAARAPERVRECPSPF